MPLLVGSVAAQSRKSQLASLEQLPVTARQPTAFVPAGWRIESRLGGDLNADQRPDSVLVLVESSEEEPGAADVNRNRALVVMLAQPSGAFQRVGVGVGALYCTKCLSRDSSRVGTPGVSLVRGDILVKHRAGTNQRLTQTQHYRYENASGRVRLVVEDYSCLDRANATFVSATTDFLTGQQIVRRGTGHWYFTMAKPTTRAVEVPLLYLEDVNLHKTIPAWLPPDFFN
ncbi:hypothetical protein LJ737_13675 [Hymenobacter sp. 15J16-1T3B]|uniref:hypothetical protein n=1 Tax=Hymenobacter sp. 15J16-1T3B TaxID=2886941 RepID=UPI001D12F832|nr:hypothetical protein [Hymenobacter sp. 15J16-1T3B]MCC3158293.1 hypothetical protein [Hymenobacter sp. 15J16-1T3B]